MTDSFKKLQRIKVEHVGSNILIPIDSANWKTSRTISLNDFRTLILDPDSLKIVFKPTVFAKKFIDQDASINRPPKTYPIDNSLHLAVDENYLYIWIEKNKSWKRILISDYS